MSNLAVIPEVVLLDTITNLLKVLKTDYNGLASDKKEESLLYLLFADLKLDRYGMFDQAVKVFITDIDDPRNIEVGLIFNAKKNKLPSIHLTLPSENEVNTPMSNGEGYEANINQDLLDVNNEVVEYRSRLVFSRRFQSRYNIVITSDNSTEVVLIYNVIKALFISVHNQLSVLDFQNIKLGGADLTINSELVPKNVFMRAFSISLEYFSSAPSLHKYQLVQGIEYTGNT